MKIKTLFIQIMLPNSEKCKWLIYNNEKKNIEGSGEISLSEITQLDNDNDIWVVISSEQVYLTEITLPKMSKADVIKTVPFALEEQLAEDAANVHFALGRYKADYPTAVAIIDKNYMLHCYLTLKEILREQFIRVKFFVPEVLLLSWKILHWSIFVKDSYIVIRTGYATGGIVDRDNLSIYLQELLKNLKTQPNEIDIYISEGQSDINLDSAILTGIKINKQVVINEWLPYLSSDIISNIPINLLQGEFKEIASTKESIYKKIIIGSLLFCIILLSVDQIIEYTLLRNQEIILQNEIKKNYESIFPNTKEIINPKLKISHELANLKKAESKSTFIRLVRKVAPIIKLNSNLKIHNIDFQDRSLKLQISTIDPMNIDKFIKALNLNRLNVKRESVNSSGNIIQATLIIEEKESKS